MVVCHPQPGKPPAPAVPANAHPLRAGSDQNGGNRFRGQIGRVTMFRGRLSPQAIQRTGRQRPDEARRTSAGRRLRLNPKTGGVLPTQPEDQPAHPKLQFINGSSETIDIFWLKSDTERVLNGSVPPGKDTIIATTLGHRFEVVGRDDKAAAKVISEVPVQGFRFDPRGRDGVPSFYTQSVRAGGFPIVASARVNPYALKEAAFIVNMMLAKRPEVREAMIKSGARLCIMACNEYTTDLPEFVRLREEKAPGFDGVSGKDYWDAPGAWVAVRLTPFAPSARRTCSVTQATPMTRSASSSTSLPTTSTSAAW